MGQGYDMFWEKVIDTMMEGVVVVDPQGIILSVNRALEEITGYRREELLGKPCALIKTDACYQGLNPGDSRQCELFQTGRICRGKCVLAKKDGSLVHILKNAALIRDDAGRISGGVETLIDISEMVAKERVISRLRRELSREDGFQGILGKTPAMLQLFSLISSATQSEAPVIIFGESGTGKELVAGAIHRLSPRSQGPLIKVNSAAIHESLLESELFGHVKGAFTGADRGRVGRFEAAAGGDIFLDEVGDMPLATQAKLLRVLQEKVIEKVGDQKPIPLDVRVITATNKDLYRLMAEGRFREDLFYRINVIPIFLPPLRERREDIPLLTEAFIERIRLKTRKPVTGVSKAALEILMDYQWPGNVRELINALEFAFVLCREDTILPEHLPASLRLTKSPAPAGDHRRGVPGAAAGKAVAGGVPGREELFRVIKAARGKKGEAARMLGVSRVTLWKWLKNHNIHEEEIPCSALEER
jgi:PAS domain S-box-containing protein